jgi:phosphoglycolate phosphatase
MDLKMPKGVLFDLDGTLLDSAPDFIASLDTLLTRHNKPKLDPEIIRSHVSDGSWKLTSLGFNIDISDEQCAVLRDELLEEYESNLLQHGGAFDGIKEMLTSLEKDDIPYGIVTNKPLRFAKPILMNEIAFKDCKTLICPDHLNAIKPDPEGILRGCKDLGLHPAECIYVGDHEKDLEAGINAGTQVIACYFGYSLKASDHEDHIHGAHHPNQLYELISRL